MGRRPLNLWAMFVVLLLVASPVMLTVPFLQFAAHARGTSGRIPIAMMIGAVVLAPVGSIVHVCVQEILEKRAHDQARALTPGTILAHVVAARQRAAGSWLSPYIWNEEAELKWIIIGVGRLGFVESPNPLSDEDTQALALLVQSSVGTGNAAYAWTLQAKLAWDSLMRAGANERPAIAAGLTPQQARSFNEYIGVPHADWLCASLADPPTEKAFNHVWTLLADHDRKQFSTGIQEKCGRSFGTVVTVESPVPRVRLRSSVTSPPIAR